MNGYNFACIRTPNISSQRHIDPMIMLARSHALVMLITTILLINLGTSLQTPRHKTSSKNVTLNFDDLPTHDGFGEISSYHHLDFSSFTLVNTSAAASAGHISTNDTYCATSSHNALIAHKAKTPSLWPRIALDPLARRLPGEAPFFSLHGMSMKAMNSSDRIVCISISAYGIDDHKSIRALDGLSVCSRESYGGYVDISGVFPGWGKTVNMVEIGAEALIEDGEEYEWVDWPFCVDDLTIEMREGEWEWPEQWWGIWPLLPPLAPLKFDDQRGGVLGRGSKYLPFSKEAAAGFEYWKAKGARGTFLDRLFTARTV